MEVKAEEEKVVEEEEKERELVRIDSCATFHKLTPGQSVPHSFVSFVRQWPAFPRVVVSFIFLFLCSFLRHSAFLAAPQRGLMFPVSKVLGSCVRGSP